MKKQIIIFSIIIALFISGCTQTSEIKIQTDADNDGMDDTWEQTHGLDATVNDANLDKDGDGLTNLEEFEAKTNPDNSDTDGDGTNDRQEIEAGSDPVDNESGPELKDDCHADNDCNDNDNSTLDVCSGTPKKCVYEKITECISDDNYCPLVCVFENDNDCEEGIEPIELTKETITLKEGEKYKFKLNGEIHDVEAIDVGTSQMTIKLPPNDFLLSLGVGKSFETSNPDANDDTNTFVSISVTLESIIDGVSTIKLIKLLEVGTSCLVNEECKNGACLFNKCVDFSKIYAEDLTYYSEAACKKTGGSYGYDECDTFEIPKTKIRRLDCEKKGNCYSKKGPPCSANYVCNCPSGNKWRSQEEGCMPCGGKCPEQSTGFVPESICTGTGGTWEFLEGSKICMPMTKNERIRCDGGESFYCTRACVDNYKCTCPAGKKWASQEDGCM